VTDRDFEIDGEVTKNLGGGIVIEEVKGYDRTDAFDGHVDDTSFEITFDSSRGRSRSSSRWTGSRRR